MSMLVQFYFNILSFYSYRYAYLTNIHDTVHEKMNYEHHSKFN